MTIQELIDRKKQLGYSYKRISALSGVPLGTVQKIFGGFTDNPRYETLRALEKALFPSKEVEYSEHTPAPLFVAENSSEAPSTARPDLPVQKKQGEYTAADRELLPEERRTELIDGVIYDMASPTRLHQTILGQIFYQFWKYIENHGGRCTPIIAPSDIFLDGDDRTVVQPDLYIICDENRLREKDLKGGPDLIVEILSPSTKRKDMFLKLHKYESAGVREYWLVDPEKRKVIVYVFGEDPNISLYGFDSKVPVAIYDGACEIDFAEIFERCKIWYE